MQTLDAYENLFKLINQDDFFQHGLNNIIYVDDEKIDHEW